MAAESMATCQPGAVVGRVIENAGKETHLVQNWQLHLLAQAECINAERRECCGYLEHFGVMGLKERSMGTLLL